MPTATDAAVELSAWQERVLAVPEGVDLFLGGGRGGGKSFTLALLALRHVEQHGARARAVFVRQSFTGCRDFEALTLDLFGRIYGGAARYNTNEKTWRFPNGATVEIQQLDGPQRLTKFLGRSTTLLLADEAGEWPTPELLDRLRGNLRSVRGVPVRAVLAANPGGVGHGWIQRRHVDGRSAWVPYEVAELGAKFVTAPSTLDDNPFVDADSYRDQLRAATATDPELRRAWLAGDWEIVRGGIFFDGVPWEQVILDGDLWTPAWLAGELAVQPMPKFPRPRWETACAIDHGRTAPLVALLAVRPHYADTPTPDGRPPLHTDTWAVVDEVALADPADPTRGLGLDIAEAVPRIIRKLDEWGMPLVAILDSAAFGQHGTATLATEYERAGLSVRPSTKDATRAVGAERLRRLLLADPGSPGVLISDRCRYTLETLRTLARKGDDIDDRGPDHAADCLRYLTLTGGVRRVFAKALHW